MRYIVERGDAGPSSEAGSMAHPVAKDLLARANSVLLLSLVCGGLALCALGAVAFDISRWIAE
jgi:hypothetical protein